MAGGRQSAFMEGRVRKQRVGLLTSVNRDHVSLVSDEMSPVSSEDLRP